MLKEFKEKDVIIDRWLVKNEIIIYNQSTRLYALLVHDIKNEY